LQDIAVIALIAPINLVAVLAVGTNRTVVGATHVGNGRTGDTVGGVEALRAGIARQTAAFQVIVFDKAVLAVSPIRAGCAIRRTGLAA
jgi:hypothetical protein